MRKRRAGIFFVGGVIFTLIPFVAYAAGLVPCGGPGDPGGITGCQACSLIQLIQGIINFLIGLSIPIAMALFAYAGVLYFTSGAQQENLTKARSIFKSVFIGFIIVLGAYLMVNTILHTILNSNLYPQGSWFTIDCVNPEKRLTNGTLDTLINEVVGSPEAPVPIYYVVNGKAPVCGPSATYSDKKEMCVDAQGVQTSPTYVSVKGGGSKGSCGAYGLSAQQSCIASYESSCNPAIGSSVDIGSDGTPVSWGLFQINLSANDVQCSNINNGQPLDCTSAFAGGAYTASNHNTRVAAGGESLFQACRSAVQNVDCNKQMQQRLQAASGGSIKPWGTAARNNCSAF